MSLLAAGKKCKVEVHEDDDGVRVICNTVDAESCPLAHPGELGLDCFGGPAATDSHMVVAQEDGGTDMPEDEKDNEMTEEESLFEEAPEEPTPPARDIVRPEEAEDEDDDAWFETAIEEFETANEYVFGLVCVKDDDGDLIATLTIDNVNIDIRLEDFIELAKALRDSLPRLKALYMEE